MEKISEVSKPVETKLELSPGFRFHPTDEELITHYLTPKVTDNSFSAIAIGEVDFNKVEPWDLPWKGKMGEREWYFFCMRDRKYPTGSRTNRATEGGYWKATGKDKEIYRFKQQLVGMKKLLVFYKGRAPKGEKTNWVMHEYRLEGKNSVSTQSSKATKNEWVISRIFKKSSGGKKVHISGLLRTNNNNNNNTNSNECSEASYLPSLMEMDFSSDDQVSKTIIPVDSFTLEKKKPLENLYINDLAVSSFSKDSEFSQFPLFLPNVSSSHNFLYSDQFIPYLNNLEHMDSSVLQKQSIVRLLIEQNNQQVSSSSTRQNVKLESSGNTSVISSPPLFNHGGNTRRAYEYGDQELPVITSGPLDIDCFWDCRLNNLLG